MQPAARDLRAAHLDDVLVRVERRARRGCAPAGSPCRARRRSGGGSTLTRREQRAAGAARRPAARGRSRSPARAGRSAAPRAPASRGAGSWPGARRRRRALRRRPSELVARAGSPSRIAQPIARKHAADQQERELRQARHEREQADHARRRPSAPCAGRGSGSAMSVPRSVVGRRARDDDAGRDRDQQRRDLRARGRRRRSAARSAGSPRRTACPAACTPTTMPPIRLIMHDQDGRHRVALDELRGAVHRAVEVGLAGDLRRGAARACSSVIRPALRSASIAICLPGIASSVKRAPTSATRPAPFVTTTNWITIEDQEDHEADDDVAADDELAERLDDVAGVAVQ